jgi:hypothetical protein
MSITLRIRTAAVAALVALSATLAAATPAEAAPRLDRAQVRIEVQVDDDSTAGSGWLNEKDGSGWLSPAGSGWLGKAGSGWL